MKVGKLTPPTDRRWKLEVIVKYPEPITEEQAKLVLEGTVKLGLAALTTDAPLPTIKVI